MLERSSKRGGDLHEPPPAGGGLERLVRRALGGLETVGAGPLADRQHGGAGDGRARDVPTPELIGAA